ncbi:hypothetical protein [Streptomyces sp. NPDC058657]|uniref:hypothetical protein n=1 Tax=unclassified Streptomyces TaxID=2593676 RepID=UPI00365C6629
MRKSVIDSESPPYSAGAWAVGWVIFLGSGFAASVLLSNAWHDCDIGINASANLGALVLASTSMAAASTLLWGLMRKVTGRRRLLPPLLMTVAAAAPLLWPLMAFWHAPDGYPVSFCAPDNVPPWWPGWLPV